MSGRDNWKVEEREGTGVLVINSDLGGVLDFLRLLLLAFYLFQAASTVDAAEPRTEERSAFQR